MSCASSDLVTKTLGWNNSKLVADTFVGLVVECKECVILFNKRLTGSFDGFCTDTALGNVSRCRMRDCEKKSLMTFVQQCRNERMDGWIEEC